MDDYEFLESLITDEKVITKIEETTHNYYKNIFNWVRLINIYKLQLKEFDNDSHQNVEFDPDHNPIEVVNKIDSPNVLKTKIKDLVLQTNLAFEELYSFAHDNNYYWCNSTLKTYKFYFLAFQRNFKRVAREESKIEFLKHEIQYFLDFEKNGFLIVNDTKTNFIHRTKFMDYFSFIDYYNLLFDINKLKIKTQNNKIIEFLKSEIKGENYHLKIKKGKITTKPMELDSDTHESNDDVMIKSNLPEFNLQERYHLLQKLGFVDIISKIDTPKKTKNMLLALTMDCSNDNARKLLNDRYKFKNSELQKEKLSEVEVEISDFLYRNKINIE